jgi:hypothetical protein
MAGGPQLVGEGVDARGQPLRVVEQQDLGHESLQFVDRADPIVPRL